MIKIGMMIGDRYEILEKIGTGGMSDVYKAKCHKLNRFVAVKVLKQEFSENVNFVSKFRVEAQAAAGLMHPNIVNVYDVGEENGIHYIVMELVEGITLKKYIEKKSRLSYKEAVSIAIQVCMGIEAAHNNHIIHRDIKPQNIMISREGKVKVTDFGIAKAATSNTITSNVMGSVHYTSPEQARGGYSDEKSDIYSLGVTLFEMLTGRVPFNGETTVAIAIKHIQEDLPLPGDFVPEIPAGVEAIVVKCCQKSPDRRYQSMHELVADLKQSLMSPDEDFVVQNGPDMDSETRMITDSDMEQIKRQTAFQDTDIFPEEEEQPYEGEELQEYEENPEEGDEYDYNPGLERATTILAIVTGVIFCIIVVLLAVRFFGGLGSNSDSSSNPVVTDRPSVPESSGAGLEYVKMPDVRGWSVEDARNELKRAGLNSRVVYEESSVTTEGLVMSANVQEDTELAVGSTVTLTASAGASAQDVPKVTGISFEAAKSSLEARGFVVTKEEAYSNDVAEGYVISQTPDYGTRVPKGINITVKVSQGRGKVQVPRLLGVPEEDGLLMVTESGLEIENVSYIYVSENDYDFDCSEGMIVYQSYSQGSYVNPGTKLEIKVSKGVEKVTYKCNLNIQAPSASEAPEYVAGTEVRLELVADNGELIFEEVTKIFPYSANYYGLKSSAGTLTVTYTVTTGGTTSTDPVTGDTVNVPGTTQERSFTRRINFVEE